MSHSAINRPETSTKSLCSLSLCPAESQTASARPGFVFSLALPRVNAQSGRPPSEAIPHGSARTCTVDGTLCFQRYVRKRSISAQILLSHFFWPFLAFLAIFLSVLSQTRTTYLPDIRDYEHRFLPSPSHQPITIFTPADVFIQFRLGIILCLPRKTHIRIRFMHII